MSNLKIVTLSFLTCVHSFRQLVEAAQCCFGKSRNCVIDQFRFANLELDFIFQTGFFNS